MHGTSVKHVGAWVFRFILTGMVLASLAVNAAPSQPQDFIQLIPNPMTGPGHDGEAGDQFGYSIAVSGNTALIGVPRDSTATAVYQGAVYVMVKTGDAWQVQTKLVAPVMSDASLFGSAVAITGDLALIGANSAPNDADLRTGAAYVFRRQGEQWQFVQRLIPQDAATNDLFGWRVAINEHTALISSTMHLDSVSGVIGEVAVFQFDGSSWTESTPWLSEGTSNVGFGTALALQGDLALVGSPGNERVAVYERSSGVWQKTRTVPRPDADPELSVEQFGAALDVDGNTVVIGAPGTEQFGEATTGRAFQYDLALDWAQIRIVASENPDTYGFAQALDIHAGRLLALSDSYSGAVNGHLHLFSLSTGASIAELDSGETSLELYPVVLMDQEILLGIPHADVLPNGGQGVVTRFVEDPAGSWTTGQDINSGNGGYGESFGHHVAISGDTAVVGIIDDDVGSTPWVRSAYVFQRGEAGWTYHSRLVPPELQSGALMDTYVDIDGDTIVMCGANALTSSTACYVYVRDGEQWTLQHQISRDRSDFDGPALSGDRLVIGDPLRAGPSGATGAVDIYHRIAGVWSHETALVPPDGVVSETFGGAVDISGNKILIGAPSQDGPAGLGDGAAYLYELGPQGWALAATWTSPSEDYFGTQVALGEHIAVVRSAPFGPGLASLHVFSDHAGAWQFESVLIGDDTVAADYFGSSIAVEGNAALVGAYGANNNRGAAYLFERGPSGWAQSRQFLPTPDMPTSPPLYGYAVAMSGTDVIIGVPNYQGPAPWSNATEGAVQILHNAVEQVFADGFE